MGYRSWGITLVQWAIARNNVTTEKSGRMPAASHWVFPTPTLDRKAHGFLEQSRIPRAVKRRGRRVLYQGREGRCSKGHVRTSGFAVRASCNC